MTVFIGDVHGKYTQYKRILDHCTGSIQVGDMGVGFRRWPHGDWQTNPPHEKMVEGKHRFIRGNHDNPNVCKGHSQWIPDGRIENDTMFIGGGLSIDKAYRVEDYSWWPDEELEYLNLRALIEVYDVARPKVMVTHDCPESIALHIVQLLLIPGTTKVDFPSRTRIALQQMLEIAPPKLWVFGHWHFPLDQVINSTRFVCLAELQTIDIDVEAL